MNTEKNDNQLENLIYNIAWLRREHGLSKRRMAKILHIGVATLNTIERGEIPPRLSSAVLLYLRDYFHLTIGELLISPLAENNKRN